METVDSGIKKQILQWSPWWLNGNIYNVQKLAHIDCSWPGASFECSAKMMAFWTTNHLEDSVRRHISRERRDVDIRFFFPVWRTKMSTRQDLYESERNRGNTHSSALCAKRVCQLQWNLFTVKEKMDATSIFSTLYAQRRISTGKYPPTVHESSS